MSQDHPKLSAKLVNLLTFVLQDPENETLRSDAFETALAEGAFREAGDQDPHAPPSNPLDVAWRHREALLHLAQGHYAQAKKILEGLLEEGKGDSVTRYNLAYAQFGMGSIFKAKEAAAALFQEPGEVAELAWSLWLRCQHHSMQLEEGLQAFVDAQSQRPMSPDAWGIASLMALDADRMEDSLGWSEHALGGNPNQMEALVARGSVLLDQQDAEAASGCFERALGLNAMDGRSWSGLAFTRMLQLDFPAALEAFQKAVTSMPFHIGTWIGLGWAEFMARHPQAAQAAFEQALALDRNFAESHGGLAVALAQQGHLDRAKTETELALKLDPRSLSARYAQSILSGESSNPEAFLRMSQRVLAQHPLPGEPAGWRTLADVVLRPTRPAKP